MCALDMLVNRNALHEVAFVTGETPNARAGDVVLRIDQFALTSNNVTYAVAPEQLGYWNFFRTDRAGWGRVPVWGFAETVQSNHPQVPTGARVYGYLPMSQYLTVTPGRISDAGFRDMAEHRQPMAPIYNHYAFTSADPSWRPEAEGLISLFRPLHTTSYLLADEHIRKDCFGANQLLLSSASSKTAIAAAFQMRHGADTRLVGLTSPGNIEFCKRLGVYDDVLPYAAVPDMDPVPSAFIDMAGNANLLRAVHAHFDDALKNSCRVGLTHWQETANFVEGLSGGPKPYFFFAPTVVEERMDALGRAAFLKDLALAQRAFLDAASGWLVLRENRGEAAVTEAWSDMLAGRIDPAEGHILSLFGE